MWPRRDFLLGSATVLAAGALRAATPASAPDCRAVALRAFEKHKATHKLEHYTGILSLQALARLAVGLGDDGLLARARAELRPFVRGERKFTGNFPNYLCGGNGTAFLVRHGHLPEAADVVRQQADAILRVAPRSRDGILTRPDKAGTDAIFIDAAFAVAPFLASAGIAFNEPAYLEESFQQVNRLFAVLRDPANGLLHQARGFSRPGRITEDHWSRGNGWGLLAVAELLDALPANHSRRRATEKLLVDLIEACLRVQDEDGLWHQELTARHAYVETSGTGLILHALGFALLRGLLPGSRSADFERGLAGYLRYIDVDGSVRNTCIGCLSPGQGTVADYIARPARTNDPHAFGPVTLAFGTAARLARAPREICRLEPLSTDESN